MRSPAPVVLLALCCASLAACDLLGGKDKDAGKVGKESESSTALPQPTPAAAPTAAAGGRSAVPTLAEWGKVREVTVKGSSALGCETKMVREWLRVSCRGKNSTGGTPTTVAVQKGAGKDVFTYVGKGVTSLVLPFEEGTQVEATFSWTDVSHKLVSSWPRGSSRPTVMGVFEGASSPLDMNNCIECFEDGDEVKARAQGKTCCTPPPCQTRAHCGGGKVCCNGPVGGRCRSSCNLTFEGPTCTSDAECPVAYGIKLTCQSLNGLRSCAGPP